MGLLMLHHLNVAYAESVLQALTKEFVSTP